MIKKTAISLISYDAEFLPNSIKAYYPYVDEILLGLDENRITWNNNSFTFDETSLWKQIKQLDTENKVHVIESNFHKSGVAIDNDNYERNFLKSYASNDWIISIDADEVLLNAKDFFNKFCPIVEPMYDKVDILMTWLTPYKKIGSTYLVIANENNTPLIAETQGIMTHKDNTYTYARWTNNSGNPSRLLSSPLAAIHWSLCRKTADLEYKINNTGHADLAAKDPFFQIWKSVTLDNFTELRNFKTSGLGTAQWPKLVAVEENNLINYYTSALGGIY